MKNCLLFESRHKAADKFRDRSELLANVFEGSQRQFQTELLAAREKNNAREQPIRGETQTCLLPIAMRKPSPIKNGPIENVERLSVRRLEQKWLRRQ